MEVDRIPTVWDFVDQLSFPVSQRMGAEASKGEGEGRKAPSYPFPPLPDEQTLDNHTVAGGKSDSQDQNLLQTMMAGCGGGFLPRGTVVVSFLSPAWLPDGATDYSN